MGGHRRLHLPNHKLLEGQAKEYHLPNIKQRRTSTFHPEDGGSTFLRNVDKFIQHYTASHHSI
jgi:hypothetical protein